MVLGNLKIRIESIFKLHLPFQSEKKTIPRKSIPENITWTETNNTLHLTKIIWKKK
jgi:hypothetical protein